MTELQSLVSSMWPADLLQAGIAAREIVDFIHKMLEAANLPKNDPQRDDKLTAFGRTFLTSPEKPAAEHCHSIIRRLLPELRSASMQSGVNLPDIWDIRVASAAELAVNMWGLAKAMYSLPRTGPKDAPAATWSVRVCMPGNHGDDVDECRRRLRLLPGFNRDNLCQLIDYELGIAAQVRLGQAMSKPLTPPSEPPPADTTPTTEAKLTAVEQGLILLSRNLNQSNRAVAKQIGCDPSALSDDRIRRFRQTQAGRIPMGSKTKEGDLEAEAENE